MGQSPAQILFSSSFHCKSGETTAFYYLFPSLEAELFGANAPLESYFPQVFTENQAKSTSFYYLFLKLEARILGADALHKSYFHQVFAINQVKTADLLLFYIISANVSMDAVPPCVSFERWLSAA